MSYEDCRVLVTGGTGFIGGRLAERLALEERARVRVLVRDWRRAVWVSRANVELVQGDVTDSAALAEAVRGCQTVFHCVGVGGTRGQCMAVNVGGTRNTLESAAAAGVERVVYLSSIAVHGPNPPDNADERDELRRTGSPYGDSKVEAEELVWRYQRERGLPVVVIRPTFVWGPRSDSFTIWPVRLMKEGRWYLVDGGRGTCHAVHVDNLVDALLLAGMRPEAVGEAFLITDGEPRTWADFYGHYARMLGLSSLPSVSSASLLTQAGPPALAVIDRVLAGVVSTPSREPARFLVRGTRFGLRRAREVLARAAPIEPWDLAKYARVGRLNTNKARAVLGYVPRVTLEGGMRDTEVWLRDQGLI